MDNQARSIGFLKIDDLQNFATGIGSKPIGLLNSEMLKKHEII